MQIHSAAERGEIHAIRYCLERGVPIDQKESEDTALLAALWSMNPRRRRRPMADTETIRFLLAAGADPNAVARFEYSALQVAAQHGLFEEVQLLCEHGADPSMETPSSDTFRSVLVRDENLKEIREFLRAKGLRLVGPDGEPNLYLEDTLDSGDFIRLKHLLDSQAELRPAGWNSVFETLIRDSAANLRNMVIQPGELNQTVGRYDYTPFLVAVAMNDTAKAEALIECGSSLFDKAWAGRSALHVAAECGRVEMIPWLIDQGIPVDFAQEIGDTPLMWACKCDRADGVAVLLHHGASAVYGDEYGRPIRDADSLEVTRLLVEQGGAEINEVDSCGEWPLKNAAFSGDYDWVKWLLDHGAKVDLTSTGETALHSAVFVDAREVARLLLERDANPNARDVDDHTPFHNVRSREMVELLRSFGGDPNVYTSLSGPPKRWAKDPLIQELL